jgi:hypothetical protein
MPRLLVSAALIVSTLVGCGGSIGGFSPGLGVDLVNFTWTQASFSWSEGAGSNPGNEMTTIEPCAYTAQAFAFGKTYEVLVVNGSHRDTFTVVARNYSASDIAEAWDTIMIEQSGTTLLKGQEWPSMKMPCIAPPTPAAQVSATS